MFQRFRDYWSSINSDVHEVVPMDDKVYGNFPAAAANFAEKTLQGANQPRDDYEEFLNLSIIFVGKTPPGGVKFRSPGALYHARWMNKALYCLKMYLFRCHFKLTKAEERSLKFAVLIYMEHWFLAPVTVSAPHSDLQFIKKLQIYRDIDSDVAQSALVAIANHLWYLTEDLAGLAFFSNDVPCETKQVILERLHIPAKKQKSKRLDGKGVIGKIGSMELEGFVTEASKELFEKLGIDTVFMTQHPPQAWSGLVEYKRAQEIASSLKVVNDTAERAVKLVTDYTKTLTTDELQLQLLLQVVEEHRVKFPDMRKSIIVTRLMDT